MAAQVVTVLDPDSGDPISIPASQLDEHLSAGYVLDTPELAAKREEQAKYSGGLEGVGSGVEGFLRGGTAGLSDLAETGLGISTAEEIRKRKEANPDTAQLSELGGLGSSLLVPGLGEESAVAHGLEAGTEGALAAGKGALSAVTAPIKGIEAAGKGAGNLTRRLLAGAPTEGVTGALAGAIPGAVDSATQAALFNAGQKIDENHLAGGDLQQGVENALASTPDALALGGLAHLGASGVGLGIRTAAAKAGQAVNSLQTFMEEKLPALTQGLVDKLPESMQGDLAGAFTPEGAAMRERKLTRHDF